MFIRHCPCKELTITFKSKTIDAWSVREVHNILNESEPSLVSAAKIAPIKISVNRTEVKLSTAALSPTSDVQQSKFLEVSALERVINLLKKSC